MRLHVWAGTGPFPRPSHHSLAHPPQQIAQQLLILHNTDVLFVRSPEDLIKRCCAFVDTHALIVQTVEQYPLKSIPEV